MTSTPIKRTLKINLPNIKFQVAGPGCKFFDGEGKEFSGYAIKVSYFPGTIHEKGWPDEYLSYCTFSKETIEKQEDPTRYILEELTKTWNSAFE